MAVTPKPEVEPTGRPVEPLPCGRDAARVWDHAAAGRLDAHELGCPHCTTAVADARGLLRLVRPMAIEPMVPPPSLLQRVVGAVLIERSGRDELTLQSPHGPASLSRVAAAAVLRHVVDGMDGVRARSCRIGQPEPGAVHVAMTVTARFGTDLVAVAARLRRLVIAAGEQVLGLSVRRMDIEVVDVFDVPEPGVVR
ncbi:Asp23/Gls24 family envelope stress response protein [Pseudonocardia asaccharolytica]|uniref:Asp23/Gls24 family envelope stress response protein n=1 Tax=Pseudonocardia asaccharolytica DSM 44247 = NBRC 16224 TaxID=1123024 RepID=A0A511CWE7_9PSEU|nr:Asp23/Gls24 family envelope stress response protein [Pseudonocardia asaccharolytica]GEL16797.1 hypothetical protein PA7_06340 [Pseudonocardia asaccharolytica DSM 44247 = NBRC 16224]